MFASLLASDCLYQWPATGAPGKSRKELSDAVLPSVALVAVQVCAANDALMVIVTLSGRVPAQMLAAWLKMNRRWAPSVVPGLPPTGARAVASLKPMPAALVLLMMITPAWTVWLASPMKAAARTATTEIDFSRLRARI